VGAALWCRWAAKLQQGHLQETVRQVRPPGETDRNPGHGGTRKTIAEGQAWIEQTLNSSKTRRARR